MTLVDIIGWVMVILTVSTFCFDKIIHIRIVCMLGCVVSAIYYGSQPVFMPQALLIQLVVFCINIVHVKRLFSNKISDIVN